jgi:catalase (peroxidase I)
MNAALDRALQLLEPIFQQFENLSWADLIVLAGTTAIEEALGSEISFCGGRTDATDGSGSATLRPNGDYSVTFDQIRRSAQLIGLTDREIVALSGRLRSPGQMLRTGYFGTYGQVNVLSNNYFKTLMSETWVSFIIPGSGVLEYTSTSHDQLFMTPFDLNLRWDATYLSIVEEFASDNDLFLQEFSAAWVKLMNIDRFDGPTGNVCNN